MNPANETDPEQTLADDRPRTIASSELLQGQKEVWIEHRVEHRSEMYRLRLTATGKLYLTK